jgi:DNA (cytosine-5)-methyltransferase 1
MATCESAEARTLFPLTSSAEGSRVNRTASQGSGKRLGTSATCGASSPVLFASCGPDGCWQRTYQDCSPLSLDGSLVEFCGTWPRSGIAWNGKAYRRQPLVPLTDEIEPSLLPTPVSYDATPGGPGNHYHGLARQARHKWPTPCGLSANQGQGDGEFGKAIRQSTPDGGQLNPTWVEWLMGFPQGWTEV